MFSDAMCRDFIHHLFRGYAGAIEMVSILVLIKLNRSAHTVRGSTPFKRGEQGERATCATAACHVS